MPNYHKLLYDLYMESDLWQRRRRRSLERAGGQCEWPNCDQRSRLQVHHLSYERLGQELDEDLIVLCPSHHGEVHKYPAKSVMLKKEVRQREGRKKLQDRALNRLAMTIVEGITKVVR